MPDPECTGPVNGIRTMDGQLADLGRDPGLLALLDQEPPRDIPRGDVRRLEGREQAVARREDGLRLATLVSPGGDAVDPPGSLVAEGVAADPGVVPVGDEDRPIRRGTGIHGPEPRVVASQKDPVVGPERRAL